MAGVAGFGVQAMALRLGSIVVVQALMVTQLLFALAVGAVFTGRRPLRRRVDRPRHGSSPADPGSQAG